MHRFILLGLFCAVALAQPSRKWQSCPTIARLPADQMWTEPLSIRQRFELRQCDGDKVVVTGYERAKSTPSLVFDTGDDYPRFLAHARNILIFQSLGGASDHVYVFTFESGKPSLALKVATKDLIQVRQTDAEVVVTVPPTTYSAPDSKSSQTPAPKKYTFRLSKD